jgi:hypothetical protein
MGEGRLPGKINVLCQPAGYFSAQKPTQYSADNDPGQGRGNGFCREGPATRQSLPLRWDRFSEHWVEESMQYPILLLVRPHPRFFLRISGEKSFHFAPAFVRQPAVNITV